LTTPFQKYKGTEIVAISMDSELISCKHLSRKCECPFVAVLIAESQGDNKDMLKVGVVGRRNMLPNCQASVDFGQTANWLDERRPVAALARRRPASGVSIDSQRPSSWLRKKFANAKAHADFLMPGEARYSAARCARDSLRLAKAKSYASPAATGARRFHAAKL